MTLGLVCDECDALSPVSAAACARCGAPFVVTAGEPIAAEAVPPPLEEMLTGPVTPPAPVAAPPPVAPQFDMGATLHDAQILPADLEPLPELDAFPAGTPSTRTCVNCGAVVLPHHKFCGECGHRLDGGGASGARHTMYQRALVEEPGRARLVLIRGEGVDSISYHLAGTEHIVGRTEGEILFADDALVSPRHANFFYRGTELHVRDEGSRNGVFVRIRNPVRLVAGQPFLVGEQLLSVQPANVEGLSAADTEGTYYYGSPRRPARIRLVQILAGGDLGMALRVPGDLLSIGREGNSVNFPEDPFISGHHAHVVPLDDGTFRLSDVGSKNGTFVRITEETRLVHGDFVFLGQQLLRVEIV